MHPAGDEESQQEVKLLHETGECLFDMSKNGSILRPLVLGSWSCTDFESKYHYFVGETACGIWAIFQNRNLLWVQPFGWLCDWAAIK